MGITINYDGRKEMKRSFFVLVAFIMLVGIAYAAPFLVCDAPDPKEQVISYIVYRDGVEIGTTDAEDDGSLKMDLVSITPGVYTWTIRSVNAWEESPLSNPYVSPSGASVPQNTRMVP